jgi:hypothetical protein
MQTHAQRGRRADQPGLGRQASGLAKSLREASCGCTTGLQAVVGCAGLGWGIAGAEAEAETEASCGCGCECGWDGMRPGGAGRVRERGTAWAGCCFTGGVLRRSASHAYFREKGTRSRMVEVRTRLVALWPATIPRCAVPSLF